MTALQVMFSVPRIKGKVVSVSGNNIVLETVKRKAVNIAVGDATVIYVRPRTAPNQRGTIADVKPGLAVDVGGRMTSQNTMNALWIDVLVP